MKKDRYVLIGAMLLSACSEAPTNPSEVPTKPGAESVRLVPADRAGCDYQVGCSYLGEVSGDKANSWWWSSDAEREADARTAMKEAAARLGADTVQVSKSYTSQSDVVYTGLAYRCRKKQSD
jgi:hypothetical protein